jgi:malate dehydrogenase (oxaloacetate-decarboxylating)(NADP+)
MFLAAAKVLANAVSEQEIATGAIYPPLTRIREVSRAIAIAVCQTAIKEGLTDTSMPDDLDTYVAALMYEPNY